MGRVLFLSSVIGLSGLATACGDTVVTGSCGADASTDGATVACESTVPSNLDLLDDMEDGNNQIAIRGNRVAYWYTYHDSTAGVLTPDQGVQVTMEPIPGARCTTSKKAMRVTGSGFMEWGSGFGFDLNFNLVANERILYDASATKGITFWARKGESSIDKVRLNILDQWSDPIGGNCDIMTADPSTACYDAFGTDVALTTTWKRYTFQWTELKQRMFGVPRDSLDAAHLTQVHFDMAASSPVFDIWIDDVSFVN